MQGSVSGDLLDEFDFQNFSFDVHGTNAQFQLPIYYSDLYGQPQPYAPLPPEFHGTDGQFQLPIYSNFYGEPQPYAPLPPDVHGADGQFQLPIYSDLQPTANHSHVHPTPSLQTEVPGARPQNRKNRCADRYREHPERIKDVVQRALEDAAASREPIECKWWPGCDAMVSTDQGALWTHLQNRHGVLHGVRVGCLWTGCAATIQSSSLVQHVKSVHLLWGVLCPLCGESFAREDTLKRHLSGER
ncbi:hypothetical protein B0H11DRAFT_2284860 [Mycena galericulata]|nr:hypothetical protein B0H11DRAFT_2284860 [Mycena galericulata]